MQEVLPYLVLRGLSSTSAGAGSEYSMSMPDCYRAAQTQAAWSQILGFLDAVLNQGWNKDRVIWRLESATSVHYDFSQHRRWE